MGAASKNKTAIYKARHLPLFFFTSFLEAEPRGALVEAERKQHGHLFSVRRSGTLAI